MLRCRFIALLMTVLFLTLAGRAFDTGPHFDLTRDALAAEGFGNTSSQVAQVTGWMTDLYAAADAGGGTAPWLRERITAGLATPETWPEAAVTAAARLQFDGTATVTVNGETKKLESGETMALEWDRLARATRAAAVDRANANDPLGLLMVLGTSLQAVQDFYAHTNWVEPAGDAAKDGFDGPGWAAQQKYGSHPTYFDVPPGVRNAARLYAGVGGALREEGFWNSDGNRNLATALNKDWPGRPLYREAYITAYFASRQWVEAMHLWVNNEPVWHAAQLYIDRHGDELDRDLAAAFKLSAHAGHWQGQGEPKGSGHEGPGGSTDKLKAILEEYRKAGKTSFRTAFEGFIPALAAQTPPPGDTTILFSWGMQAETDFIVLTLPRLRDDEGKADLYARATVAGQPFTSAILHGDDDYSPAAPITFIKSVPADWKIDEPVTSLRVEVATGDGKDASTDDDVFLALNENVRLKLERPKVNGFEKGSRETYALTPPSDLLVRDIRFVQLEKGPDGKNGNWQLKGVKLEVNGQPLYLRDKVDAVLAGGNLAWRAPDFVGRGGATTDVPVMLALYADSGQLGKDTPRDINPDFGRLDLMLLLDRTAGKFRGDLNGAGKADAAGGSKYGGKGKEGTDPGKALLAFAVENARTVPSTTRPGKITATLTAQPAAYSGKLPVTIAFNGSITVDGPCDVTYRFVRSDGAIMLTKILHFDDAGTKAVQDNWLIKQALAGWMTLKVVAPLTADSNKAEFEVKAAAATTPPPTTGTTKPTPPTNTGPSTTTKPTAPSTTGAATPPTIPTNPGAPQPVTVKGITVLLTANPVRHTGALPVTINFKGSITVNKAMDMKYRLIRSDGMTAPPKTIHFGAAGTKEVSDIWVQRKEGAGWMLLRIEDPAKLDSNKAEFEVAPGAPPTTTGPATPPTNTGPANPPTNTGPATPPTNTGPATPPTTTSPATGTLNKVTAVLGVKPARYIWRLPAIVTFSGTITADGPGTVAYRFVRSDGAIMPLRVLTFKTAGTLPIQDVWMFKQAFNGWMQLKIELPLETESNQVPFEVAPTDEPLPATLPTTPTAPTTPTTPTPPTTPVTPTPPTTPTTPAGVKVTATLAANPAKYAGKYPAVMTFKGSITVDRPCEVKYRFLRSDDAIMPEQTLRFTAAGTKEVQEFWVLMTAGAGWVSLNVSAPVATVAKADFEVLPEGAAPATATPVNTTPTTTPTVTTPTTPATPATPTVTTPTTPTTPTVTIPPTTPATPGKLGATLTADPARTNGNFPAFVTFKGAITADAPGTISYRFVRSDGAIMPLRTLIFKTAGTKEIKDAWVFKQTFSGWMQIKIEAPAAAESNQAAFEVPGG